MFLHQQKTFLLALSVSIIRVHSTQGVCSFPPAQKCWGGLTLTSLCSALEQKGCCHPFCSAETHLILCFHVVLYSTPLVTFSTCKHIFCLFTLASSLSECEHTGLGTLLCSSCAFLHVAVCLYFTCDCFLPAALKSCKHSNFFWHIEAAMIATVLVR